MTIPRTTPGTLGRVRTPLAAIVRRLVVTSAVALTVFGLGAPAASAEEDEKIDVDGGYAEFTNSGADIGQENLWVGDDRRDGVGVRAYLDWHDADGRHTVSVTASNSTEDADDNVVVYVPEAPGKGTAVTLSVCYIDNGHVKQCSLGQRAYG
jgi:hypothetical protein